LPPASIETTLLDMLAALEVGKSVSPEQVAPAAQVCIGWRRAATATPWRVVCGVRRC